ncbi:MAG: CFI-box-CTERM domain-containing protein [Bdellovibrionales bacterium]
MSKSCPSCGAQAESLLKVDTGKKVALNLEFDEVCANCYEALPSKISQGMKLRQEEELKQKNKIKLWKGRVDLIKQARNFMQSKAWSEAAISYEKYIKVLELIYELEPNGLTPEVFSNDTRSKELTLVVTVYWDLLRIYDQSPRTHERMDKVVKKLIAFAPYSGIYPDLVRKAESLARGAKNPKPFREFLKESNAGRSGCFIATAAFENGWEAEVVTLRKFRDDHLMHHWVGKTLIRVYYIVSPSIARFLNTFSALKAPTRAILRALIQILPKSS